VALCLLVLVFSAGSAAGTVDSSGSPSVFSVPSDCSEATARQVVEQHPDVNPFALQDPIRQVLCGPFTGPGSNAMAVTIAAPTCWPIQNWAVFRFAGGDWRLVLNQPAYLIPPLVAVGSDIRETTAVYRRGDSRCFPSGGTHARIWHWNETRLGAGPWKQVTGPKTAKVSKLFYFESPSHNIWCDSGDEGIAYCATKIPARSVGLKLNGSLTICARRRCSGPAKFGGDPVLAYGRVNEQGGFRCKSAKTGITCTVVLRGEAGYGKGFLINSSGVRRVRP
jgi:hypothetical protein